MAKVCAITGKHSTVGRRYSNRTRANNYNPVRFQTSNNQTTRNVRRKANLQKKTFFISELGKKITLTVSTKGMRTINKLGLVGALKKSGILQVK